MIKRHCEVVADLASSSGLVKELGSPPTILFNKQLGVLKRGVVRFQLPFIFWLVEVLLAHTGNRGDF